MTRDCPTCKQQRADKDFQRVLMSPSGFGTVIPTRECIHCISKAAIAFHQKRHKRERREGW